MQLTPQAIAQILDAPLVNPNDVTLTSTVFDSRLAEPNSLFIPLTVGGADGHDYLASAVANGSAATLWAADHKPYPTDVPAIIVPDTLQAFQAVAQAYLQTVKPKIVAVSGSNGKTTTKDLIESVGKTTYKTVKTPANFNNEVGVPTTILAMPADTELLILEMGMDHPGDLTLLSDMVQPDIAVLTMIGEAHIEFFKTRGRIADGKMEIISGLAADGTLVYNGDEPLLRERVAQHADLHTATFGFNPENDLYATSAESTTLVTNFTTNQTDLAYQLPLPGRYNVSNALSAIQVGKLLGITDEKIQQALATANITENRTQWLPGKFGGQILSDVYNSNPTAASEVLRTFKTIPTDGQRYAVLGDMLQLGETAPTLHAQLARDIDRETIAGVYLVGPLMIHLAEELEARGYPREAIFTYGINDLDQLAADLQKVLQPTDLLMAKGSHGIHLENLVAQLLG